MFVCRTKTVIAIRHGQHRSSEYPTLIGESFRCSASDPQKYKMSPERIRICSPQNVLSGVQNAPAPVPVVPVPERPAFMDALAAEITLPADAETYVPLLPPVPPAPPPTTPTLLPGLFVQVWCSIRRCSCGLAIEVNGSANFFSGSAHRTVQLPVDIQNEGKAVATINGIPKHLPAGQRQSLFDRNARLRRASVLCCTTAARVQ